MEMVVKAAKQSGDIYYDMQFLEVRHMCPQYDVAHYTTIAQTCKQPQSHEGVCGVPFLFSFLCDPIKTHASPCAMEGCAANDCSSCS